MKEITLITPKGVKKGKVVTDYKWYIEGENNEDGEIIKIVDVGFNINFETHTCIAFYIDEKGREWHQKGDTNTWVLQEGAD